jgi:hypothetical protein
MATIVLRATKGSPLTNNEVDANFNNLNTELGTKLASADFTGANILTKIKTVDGALSGLDADTLDGYNQDNANTANTIVRRDASGNFSAGTITATLDGNAATATALTGTLAVANGGTGATTASSARSNLGLAIGSDVQAYSAVLTDIGGLTQAADAVPYFDSSSTASTFTVTSTARSLLDDTSISAMRSTLGLAIGSNIQPYDADLSGLASVSTNGYMVRTGNGTFAARILSAGTGVTVDDANASSGNTTISIGQAVATSSNVRFNSIGLGANATGSAGSIYATGSAQVDSLGVGTAASGSTGEIRATNDITAHYSDVRLKENIKTIESALDKVNSITGVTYNANALAESFGYTNKDQQVGVLAHEIEAVLPEAVKPAPFDRILFEGTEISKSGEDYKTVQYEKLVPLLIEAIKELNREVNELKGIK